MSYADITKAAVVRALEEHDQLGEEAFLHRHGFGPSAKYILRYEGRDYPSKAIVGVAHGYARPDLGALASSDFSGGVHGAARVLVDLGFEVVGTSLRRPALLPDAGRPQPLRPNLPADIVLVGCVKLKAGRALPAEDLYVSPLFKKRRAYAERASQWFVLSALHGLVSPEAVLEPYDMALADQPVAYRREWGDRVLTQLLQSVGALAGKTIEIHAGSVYAEAIAPLLTREGALVVWPFRGLTQGGHLAWYGGQPSGLSLAPPAAALATGLADAATARLVHGFPWPDVDLRHPGLYAWFVDVEGAHELTACLGQRVAPGLVYAGQAGATSSRSAKESGATLASRIGGNHLGGDVDSSTWRRTLAALLLGDEARTPRGRADLDAWMHRHLRLNVAPLPDRAAVGRLEEEVLGLLDPPLNLMGRPRTEVRLAIRERRRLLSL